MALLDAWTPHRLHWFMAPSTRLNGLSHQVPRWTKPDHAHALVEDDSFNISQINGLRCRT